MVTVVLVTCVDKRLHAREDGRNLIDEFCRNQNFQPYLVASAGGILDLVRPAEPGFDGHIMRNIRVGVSNGAGKIVLMNHETCHAYGISDIYQERSAHVNDLLKATMIIGGHFSGIPIYSFMGALEKESRENFFFPTIEEYIKSHCSMRSA